VVLLTLRKEIAKSLDVATETIRKLVTDSTDLGHDGIVFDLHGVILTT